MRLDHVRLDVSDMARALRFYHTVLGMQIVVTYHLPGRTLAQVAPDGNPPGIELWWDASINVVAHPTHHIAFQVDDVPAAVRKVKMLGHAVRCEPYRIGAETVAFVSDPDGHLLEFNDFRGRSERARAETTSAESFEDSS